MSVRARVLRDGLGISAPRLVSLVSLVVAAAGCGGSGGPSGPPPERGTLAAGIVARVGQEEVNEGTVTRIATAQGVDAAAARELAVRDALFASEARSRGASNDPDLERRVSAALARRLLHQLLAEADHQGPVTDAELARVMERRWIELDRPEGFRTVHAVVRFAENADAATKSRAETVARAIREAVLPVSASARTITRPQPKRPLEDVNDPVVASFRSAVDGVDKDGFEIVVEALAPVTADGRLIRPEGGTLVESFARAASELAARGDTSPLVPTSYGVHVLVLLERTPASIVPLEERRRLVRDEVVWGRASAARSKLLEGLRRDVLVERNAESLLALVPIER
ncbi:peptidyl-prolyl cis-trans isomerase [Polyangium sp. y55x31]|uniref:peptidylprolyl isomerase n=1 Tax=Polyangium sp. y55x31 TaxID=3042688 RepID=UPI00248253D7|nr:peptidyl-prolyl cis-trans isomerase [Polyangium sp. y55x31]MDI1478257.1 peptidyl-prolyl cis-trans isomerase [Polyangium sp. y55x31]